MNDGLTNEFCLYSLQFSESVFRSEMRHKHDSISRRLLCQTLNVKPTVSAKVVNGNAATASELGVPSSEKSVPLLYYFINHFKSVNTGGS